MVNELNFPTEETQKRIAAALEAQSGTRPIQDYSGSPGSNYIAAGDKLAGFYDIVQAADFITGDALASALGLTAGTSYFSDSPWAKVSVDNKLVFFPIKPLRYGLSWDSIYNAGAVYGDGSIGTLPPQGRLGTELEVIDSNTLVTTGYFTGDKSSTMDYYDTVGAVGDTIVLSGWDNEENNGEFTISEITETTLTVTEGGLVAENGDRDCKLWPKANEVAQNATVDINGLTFKVRLPKGFDEDPMNSYADGDRGAVGEGSEWNKVVLPLHQKSIANTWNYPQYAGDVENWGINLTNEDMILHHDFGSGSARWCQEVRDDDQTFRRGSRGYHGASYAPANSSWNTTSYRGWCPFLILS